MFLPERFVLWASLGGIKAYRGIFFVIGLLAYLLLFAHFIGWSWNRVCLWYERRLRKKAWYGTLSTLNDVERGYIKESIESQSRTIRISPGDSVGEQLAKKNILIPASVSSIYDVEHSLSEEVREYITKHPKLLEGAVPYKKKPPYGVQF